MANTTNNIEEQEVVSVSSDNAPAEDALSQEAEQTEAPKRRRGRPRKTEVENAEDNTEEKPKRRGRPRKADADLQAESETEQADVEEKPKRRGRPRKSEEAEVVEEKPKRRGRPRKVEVDQETEPTAEESAEELSDEKPKRRGRPRKVASEQTPTPEEQSTDITEDVEDQLQDVADGQTQDQQDTQENPVMGVRRRRVAGVSRTISEVESNTDSQEAEQDAPRRVRRTRRVASEEELRAAKAEADAAKKLASEAEQDTDETSEDTEIIVEIEEPQTQDVVEDEEVKTEKVKRKKVNEPTLSLDELSTWKVAELREKAQELDLDPTGIRKAELIELVFEENARREGYKSFSGIFDPSQDGFGFIRSNNYVSGKDDVFVAKHLIRKFGLRAGDYVVGATQPPRAHNQLPQLLSVESINGLDPDEARKRPRFKNLTPIYPQEQLVMEMDENSITGRAIDIVAPIGKGQRGLIVSPPKAGKTTILKKICESISKNNSEVHLICLLIDERPEEVTDMRRSIKGEVVASTFDMPPENHTQISELVMERAKRLVEQGEDVVVVLDSITRLARAYNLALPASGRILSGGFDSAALYPPKRFLGAARNIEGGGSLTILASALIDTGSKMDEVIFEEFKGTGNMELKLDRGLADKRIYPAIDPIASGTRNEDLLVDELTRRCMWGLRRTLANINNIERAQTMLIKGLKSTKTNQEFLRKASKKANSNDYAGLDKTE